MLSKKWHEDTLSLSPSLLLCLSLPPPSLPQPLLFSLSPPLSPSVSLPLSLSSPLSLSFPLTCAWEKKVAIFVEWDCHDTICEVEGLLYSVTMVYINVNVQNTGVISADNKHESQCLCTEHRGNIWRQWTWMSVPVYRTWRWYLQKNHQKKHERQCHYTEHGRDICRQ